MPAKPTFLQQVVRSCYDLEFYRHVRTARTREGLRYLGRLYLTLGAIAACVFAPTMLSLRTTIASHVRATVPENATFSVKGGQFATNVPQPFTFGPKELPMVIDTSVTGETMPDARRDRVLLGRDAAFVPAEDGTVSVAPYRKLPDATFTRAEFLAAADGISPFAIITVAILLAFAWAAALFLGAAFYVAAMSLAAWVGGQMAGVKLTYRQWFATGCHVLTLPVLATLGFGATLGRVPFLTTGIFILFAYAIISDERQEPVGPVSHARGEPAEPDPEDAGRHGKSHHKAAPDETPADAPKNDEPPKE